VESARRRRLAAAMSEQDLGAFLITDLVNVRYLTGFTGSNGAALVLGDGRCWLATDSRYDIQAAAECPDVEPIITRSGPAELLACGVDHGCQAIGFEEDVVTFSGHQTLAADSTADLTPVGPLVQQLRMIKDEIELDLLRQACAASDQALALTLPMVRPGVSERDIARWLDDAMRDLTPEGPGFETIVAAGENSAIPHHTPTDRPVGRGDLLKMDFGAKVGGYHADMTRTVLVGKPPSDWQQEIYTVVAAAQQAGRDALATDATGVDVDRAARDVVEQAGWGHAFTHGLGHGVGLQIHEAPFLGSHSPDRLAAAVPVTVEPGVYLPGRGGVRIEDTVVVHQDRVELLTTSSRELLVLD
jgi:Xaa-Pro aminopeptidase